MDLIILVADKNAEFALRGLLERYHSLRIRPISYQVFVHPEADAGVLLGSHDFLRSYAGLCEHALVVLDRAGSGHERDTRGHIEQWVEDGLARCGWDDRAAAVVIDPELEAWVWSDSPHVADVLGWKGRVPNLRNWLLTRGFISPEQTKPSQPKEAMEEALRVAQKPRSSAVYERLGRKVSVRRCTDPAFGKLIKTFRAWFPE